MLMLDDGVLTIFFFFLNQEKKEGLYTLDTAVQSLKM